MRATDDIQRQMAAVPVMPVEEPPFLLIVQRVVRRNDIQHDAGRRRRVLYRSALASFDPTSSSRCSVLFPASAAPRSAGTAITRCVTKSSTVCSIEPGYR